MRQFTGSDEAAADLHSQSHARDELQSRFSHILEAHGAALSRLAGSYARSSADREDLLQDIALAIWKALPTFRSECSERTFIFRIAHNRGIRHLSRKRPLVSLEAEEVDPEDPALPPEMALSRQQESDWLLRAIQTLPPIYREILVLALEGMDYAEISQVLGIGASNVGVRLNRARQMLKRLLERAIPGRSAS